MATAQQRRRKKGGDNLGFSGHKRVKGDKVVAVCDRRCHVIAPFVVAPGNRNEAPLLRERRLQRVILASEQDHAGGLRQAA